MTWQGWNHYPSCIILKIVYKQARQISIYDGAEDAARSWEDLLIDSRPSPENQVELDELSRAAWGALQRLPAEQRAAVVMKYYLPHFPLAGGRPLLHPAVLVRRVRHMEPGVLDQGWDVGDAGSHDGRKLRIPRAGEYQ